MSLVIPTKINLLLRRWPSGAAYLTSWLNRHGYSSQLLNRYKHSGWIESLGNGAVIRAGDQVGYHGGIFALQTQADMTVHVGGRTALSLLGRGQYADVVTGRVVLFGGAREALPLWFRSHDWGTEIDYYATSFLPPSVGLTDLEMKTFAVKVSGPARAMLECLYLTPKHQDFYECYELMEGLNNLNPKTIQQLLEGCSSIKAKRLFLYLADKAKHDWLEHLDLSRIDLGSGKRRLVENGIYIDKYRITVPREFERDEKSEL